MTDIETLTDEERACMGRHTVAEKALRIIDALTANLEVMAIQLVAEMRATAETEAKYQALLANSKAREKELKESWDDCHSQHLMAEARVTELERDRAAIDLHSTDLIATLARLRARIADLEAELKGHQMMETSRD